MPKPTVARLYDCAKAECSGTGPWVILSQLAGCQTRPAIAKADAAVLWASLAAGAYGALQHFGLDPTGATSAIAKSSLPPEQQQSFLQRFNP